MKVADYIVKWRYEDVHFMTLENELELRRAVRCLITKDGDKDTIIAKGISICSPVDNFDREKGRRLSFERAVNATKQEDFEYKGRNIPQTISIFPSKEVRAAFWEAYRTTTKVYKWGEPNENEDEILTTEQKII